MYKHISIVPQAHTRTQIRSSRNGRKARQRVCMCVCLYVCMSVCECECE